MPRVLLVGSGGREHALAYGLLRSRPDLELFAAPGNPGLEALGARLCPVAVTDVAGLVALAQAEQIDLVVIGPEAPLVLGLADRLRGAGIAAFGPNQAAAQLEGSKAFAKQVMIEAGVPTAAYGEFRSVAPAVAFAARFGGRVAVKADGLAAGKGVIVTDDLPSAERAIADLLGGALGDAGRTLLVEERLEGEELSVLALVGGGLMRLPPAQDHKRIYDGDQGPNTGGMGAYCPAPLLDEAALLEIERTCLRPVVALLASRGIVFSGVLYAGIMVTKDGPKVLEYNVRFGDPETQAIVPVLDEDLYALFSAAAHGMLDNRPARLGPQKAVTVVLAAEFYPETPRTGDPILGLEGAKTPDSLVFHAGTRRANDQILTAGGRVLGVTGLGATLADARRAAYATAERIEWPGRQYRSDIGARALGPR